MLCSTAYAQPIRQRVASHLTLPTPCPRLTVQGLIWLLQPYPPALCVHTYIYRAPSHPSSVLVRLTHGLAGKSIVSLPALPNLTGVCLVGVWAGKPQQAMAPAHTHTDPAPRENTISPAVWCLYQVADFCQHKEVLLLYRQSRYQGCVHHNNVVPAQHGTAQHGMA